VCPLSSGSKQVTPPSHFSASFCKNEIAPTTNQDTRKQHQAEVLGSEKKPISMSRTQFYALGFFTGGEELGVGTSLR